MAIIAQPSLTLAHWATLRFHLRWAYKGEIPIEFLDYPVDHSATYLAWLVLEGGVEVETAQLHYQVTPGNWFVVPRTKLSQRFVSGTRLLSINVCCQWPSGLNLFAQNEAALSPPQKTHC